MTHAAARRRSRLLPLLMSLALAAAPWTLHAEERVTLEPGGLLSFITSRPRPDGREARDEYFTRVLPLAARHGFRSVGGLRLEKITPDDYAPTLYMSFFAWPGAEARAAFHSEPEWPSLRAMRPRIWQELRICVVRAPTEAVLRFREDRAYSVSFAWLDPERGEDFDRYLAALRPTLEQLGVVKVFEAPAVEYSSLLRDADTPDRVWVTEWPEGAREQYLGSDAFRENVHLFRSGVAEFQRYGGRFSREAPALE